MIAGIFEFWSKVRPDAHIHPADEPFLSQNGHHFDLTGLPGCWMGPLRTAPVILLYLAPGPWNPEESVGTRYQQVRDWHARTRTGFEPLPTEEYSFATFRWWSQRTRVFGNWQDLRSKVAFLNLVPYHSDGDFRDYGLLGEIPSSAEVLDWATKVLFPSAVAGKRVVVCLRSCRRWGLEEGQTNGCLFAPQFNRAGHMYRGELRERVVAAVRSALISSP